MTAFDEDTSPFTRSASPIRALNAAELGLVTEQNLHGNEYSEDLALADDDPLLLETISLLHRYGGVIFVGPPGTSKTYFAQQIALKLTNGNSDLVRFVQFHPSYQYEDFVQGYVPRDTDGDARAQGPGFELKDKHLMQMCELARDNSPENTVIVIDELSRGDPARVFGESLTYIERSKRGLTVSLASGRSLSIPENLYFLCTMNALDRGVDDVDAAFERRFAKIPFDPNETLLSKFLEEAGMSSALREKVVQFFRWVNSKDKGNPYGYVGHTYFIGLADEVGLKSLWKYQLRFLFEKAYQLDKDGLLEVTRRWERIFGSEAGPSDGDAGTIVVGESDVT